MSIEELREAVEHAFEQWVEGDAILGDRVLDKRDAVLAALEFVEWLAEEVPDWHTAVQMHDKARALLGMREGGEG